MKKRVLVFTAATVLAVMPYIHSSDREISFGDFPALPKSGLLLGAPGAQRPAKGGHGSRDVLAGAVATPSKKAGKGGGAPVVFDDEFADDEGKYASGKTSPDEFEMPQQTGFFGWLGESAGNALWGKVSTFEAEIRSGAPLTDRSDNRCNTAIAQTDEALKARHAEIVAERDAAFSRTNKEVARQRLFLVYARNKGLRPVAARIAAKTFEDLKKQKIQEIAELMRRECETLYALKQAETEARRAAGLRADDGSDDESYDSVKKSIRRIADCQDAIIEGGYAGKLPDNKPVFAAVGAIARSDAK